MQYAQVITFKLNGKKQVGRRGHKKLLRQLKVLIINEYVALQSD